MKEAFLDLLFSYLAHESDIDVIRAWIDLNVWDASPEEREVIDQVAVELAYIDDGNSSEDQFRARMVELFVPTVVMSIPEEQVAEFVLGHSNSSARLDVTEPLPQVDDLLVKFEFA